MNLLLLSDIQGNLTALDTVLASPEAGVADLVLCLGDVASGPRPAAVIARLQDVNALCLRGNMDEVIADPPAPSGTTGEARHFADIDAWCSGRLSDQQRRWLASLPTTAERTLPGDLRLFACHGSPRSLEEALGAATPEAELHAALEDVQADIVAVGHLHEQLLRRLDERVLLHPGSVGWPRPLANGRRPRRAEFATIETGAGGVRLAFHRRAYQRDSQRRDVMQGGMPHGDWFLTLWQDA